MTVERLTLDEATEDIGRGHRRRYILAGTFARPGDVVMDVACGVGYGALAFDAVHYDGYDRPGVFDERIRNDIGCASISFHPCDLDEPSWCPEREADIAVCFETLEHLVDPHRVAQRIARWTRRLIFVSVPVVPTAADNPYHLHDFDVDDVPELFPSSWVVLDEWEQPDELSHVWCFGWR